MDAATLDRVAAAERPRLISLAYRMSGSMSDAEDIVQDALLKAYRAPQDALASPEAYLTTITTRTAIDHLRSARVRREQYVGPWLPEPVLRDPAPDASASAVLAESLSMAFLVILESLTPDERAALLLHDVFGYDHRDVAAILERTEVSSRQLLRRARQRIADDRPRFPADGRTHRDLLRRFLAACQGGDMDAFLRLLADDAVSISDGGAAVKAARHPIRGAQRMARFYSYVMAKMRARLVMGTARINGEESMVMIEHGRLVGVVQIGARADGTIESVRWVRNPAKLARLDAELGAELRAEFAAGSGLGESIPQL